MPNAAATAIMATRDENFRIVSPVQLSDEQETGRFRGRRPRHACARQEPAPPQARQYSEPFSGQSRSPAVAADAPARFPGACAKAAMMKTQGQTSADRFS